MRLTHHHLKGHGKVTMQLGEGEKPKLDPLTEAGGGLIRDKQYAYLAELIEKVNSLFGGELTDDDRLGYVNVVKDKLLESKTLGQQTSNNSKHQFGNSPDLREELNNAIMAAFDAHTQMSTQALNSPEVRAGCSTCCSTTWGCGRHCGRSGAGRRRARGRSAVQVGLRREIMTSHGRFPFGRPNTERPLRAAASETTRALVVGVYPSAFHVAWSPPADLDDRSAAKRGRPYVASLAVDVEPTVFWEGKNPSPAALLEQWKSDVVFKDAWGTVRPGHNGPSGAGLLADYLGPLQLAQDDVAMTDAVPWFYVKDGRGSQRAAIQRLSALSEKAGLRIDVGELPARPSTNQLVAIASSSERRQSLRRELLVTGAPLVLTLGQESLDAVRAVADSVKGVPERLDSNGEYGREGELIVDGHRLRWIPLAHPGLLRQAKVDSPWRQAHRAWGQRLGRVAS